MGSGSTWAGICDGEGAKFKVAGAGAGAGEDICWIGGGGELCFLGENPDPCIELGGNDE